MKHQRDHALCPTIFWSPLGGARATSAPRWLRRGSCVVAATAFASCARTHVQRWKRRDTAFRCPGGGRRPLPPWHQMGKSMRIAYDQLLFGPAAARAADTRDEIDRAPTDALLSDIGLIGSALAAEAASIPCALLAPTISLQAAAGRAADRQRLASRRTRPKAVRKSRPQIGRFIAVMNEWLAMGTKPAQARTLPRLTMCWNCSTVQRDFCLRQARHSIFQLTTSLRTCGTFGHCWTTLTGRSRGQPRGLLDRAVPAHWYLSALPIKTRPMHCNAP